MSLWQRTEYGKGSQYKIHDQDITKRQLELIKCCTTTLIFPYLLEKDDVSTH